VGKSNATSLISSMAILVLVLAGCCDLVTSFQVTRSQLVITQTQMAIEEIRFIAWHKRWLSTKILKVWVILHHYIVVIFAGNSIKKWFHPLIVAWISTTVKTLQQNVSVLFDVLHLITTWCNVRKNHSFTGRKGAWGL